MMTDNILKEFELSLKGISDHLRQELQTVRSNRPSVQMLEDMMVSCYDQQFPIKQLGSISIVPPREIQIAVWDKAVVGAVTKTIEDARIGLSVSAEGTLIHARLSPLGEERRAELSKLVRKAGEAARVAVRARRDEMMKRIKTAEDAGDVRQDAAFTLKEKAQDMVNTANSTIESLVEAKLKELEE